MNLSFSQIYPEVATSFGLSSALIGALRGALADCKLEIHEFEHKFNGPDYSLVFIISASRRRRELEVKGPTTLAKRRMVEFALHIPFVDCANEMEMITYVLSQVSKGIQVVFHRYHADGTAVDNAIDAVLQRVARDPDAYRYVERD